ncbi:MAG: M28 family peptidase [Gammaproteobacteria bacterium]|nr:M28 family peptidase [Gammaproteobacteria bacterium]MBT8105762.1 M28 family peptidase [Gammaproteobacteria bacterium]NNF49003.1 M28 family peptidase [Woeseiaceae bacterium]NNK25776.1 M28 family peptidase [Woeseiaceae bacterium]NNL63017.1 M28 family peptidase [Woeseiaceae bacterium]
MKRVFSIALLLGLAACTADEEAQETAAEELAASASPAAVSVAGGNPAAETASGQITDAYMREIVVEISDDRYEGRGPGTPGDEMARAWLIERMAELELEPGGANGSWEQAFDLVGVNASQPTSWTFEGHGQSKTLRQWDEFIVSSGVQEPRAVIDTAELVFVGYGMQAPEYDWDDFKGADLTGKVLLIMNNDPDWDPELFAGETRLWYGRWDYKYLSAARQGAAGAIIIHTSPSAGYPFQVVQTSWTGVQFELPAGDEPRTQMNGWVTEDTARELVAMAGHDLDELRERAYNRDFEPVPLGITTSLEMDVEITRVQSANVLGLIPGSDPELRDEVVVYTAHHDHLGTGTPNEDGDAIYNGAMDNATGVAQVMAIARAIKALPEAPRRSVLVNLVGAEEQGLLGSEYYAANPTFAPGKIAANLNYDGGNIWGHTHDVTFIGLGKSTIDEIATLIAEEQGRVVKPDQFADKGYFYRSDQFSFAKIGVPAMYLDTGTDFVDRPPEWGREQQNHYTEVNYHQPTDEYDPAWNFDGMVDDALLGYWTGLAIANADEMPTWVPGDEFEAARIEALRLQE